MTKIQFTKHKIYCEEYGIYESTYNLLIKTIDKNDFNREISYKYNGKNIDKKIIFNIQYDSEKKIILFDVKYGMLTPISVWDETVQTYRKDILSESKVHITSQFFLFITNKDNDCYISNIEYKNIFLSFLKDTYNLAMSIEDVRKSFDQLKNEFESQLNTISNIKIKCCDNLFYKEIFNTNILDKYDEASAIEINFKFKSKIKKSKSKEIINHITGNYHIDDYDFQGEIDETHILKFNRKSLIESFFIDDIEKNIDGYYNSNKILINFIGLLDERNKL